MFKSILPIIFALVVALFGGIYSAEYVTGRFEGFGALRYGPWVAFPLAGSTDADPYARARYARTGRIPLGSAEGLAFIAYTDDADDTIRAECSYVIKGKTPPARTWTLRMVDEQLFPVGSPYLGAYALNAGNVLRHDDGGFTITASRTLPPGNWLQSSGTGVRSLVLTLYDTSVASTTGVAAVEMPSITRTRCGVG